MDELNDHFVSVGSFGRNIGNDQYTQVAAGIAPNQFCFQEITGEDVMRNMKRITLPLLDQMAFLLNTTMFFDKLSYRRLLIYLMFL